MSEDSFVNEPSSLDELTHAELQLMHKASTEAMLFAKAIQWRSVGATLLVFGAIIAIAFAAAPDKSFTNTLSLMTILMTCGVIVMLVMYQFWQFNEIQRITEIEKHFSSLYNKIQKTKSRREGNYQRYTLLGFMIITIILGAVVANISISHSLIISRF